MNCEFPILEFDPDRQALIDPLKLVEPHPEAEEVCVLCFFNDLLGEFVQNGRARVVAEIRSEQGVNPILDMETDEGRRFWAVHPGVGAPLAAGYMEELIALGVRKFIACGGGGALKSDLTKGHIVIPDAAVRDEGTSYHYLPPSREVQLNSTVVNVLSTVLAENGVRHFVGKTWTTDGFYRETPKRITRRKEEGCLIVEMECAAFAAVAQFRNVMFGQLLYAGDDVSQEVWDSREWKKATTVREKLFWLAAQCALAL